MDKNRILELAIEELQKQKAGIDAEIDYIRKELNRTGPGLRQAAPTPERMGRKRARTPAERRAQAQRMREYWAAKRLAGKTSHVSAKARTKSDAHKLALSLKMKEVWKKRKAAAAKAAKPTQKRAKEPTQA
jgi:hypothetical protein